MDTFADLVAQFSGAEAGGFDFDPAQTASLLNEGLKRFAARSEWMKAEVSLGPTVAGQEQYGLPTNVVKLRGLAVAGAPYTAVDVLTLWQYKVSGLPRRVVGAYAERFNDDGNLKTLSLFPIPDTAGIAINGLAVITPDDLSGNDKLPFPPEFNRGPLDYAKGIAYEDVDENAQAGVYYIARADERADELRLEAQSRTGSGPYRIPVASARR